MYLAVVLPVTDRPPMAMLGSSAGRARNLRVPHAFFKEFVEQIVLLFLLDHWIEETRGLM